MFKLFVKWIRSHWIGYNETTKYYLSIVYAVAAWNAALYTMHILLVPKKDMKNIENNEQHLQRIMQNKSEVRIIKMRGLHKENDEVIINSEASHETFEPLGDFDPEE